VNSVSWSNTTIPTSASPTNVGCWVPLDPTCISSPQRCVNRSYGSWPGLMHSTWRTLAATAGGWWNTWLEMGSQSAATGCETSYVTWGDGLPTRNHAPSFLDLHPSAFTAWLISVRLRLWIRCGPLISPPSRYRRGFCIWWRSWISSPGTCSAGRFPTALTRSSAWRPWKWRWEAAVSLRSSTPIRVVNSRHLPSWPDCRLRRLRSAGQEGSADTTTSSWNGFGDRSSTSRSTCVATAMVGRLRSAWHAPSGGLAI